MSVDQALNFARSVAGTPSVSAMTITGSGTEKSLTTSMRPGSGSASISSSAISPMWGRMRSTTRGVNALLTRLRMRVCAGGSMLSMVGVVPSGPELRRYDSSACTMGFLARVRSEE